MNILRMCKYFLIIALVFIASYFAYNLISSDITQKNNEQAFCSSKCTYSEFSYLWEFSGEYSRKGFTTKDECFNFCSKSWEGFAYRVTNNSYAALLSLPFVSFFLK
jgi:hypothetical protein